jgi:small-conductance mechanosensitive channel
VAGSSSRASAAEEEQRLLSELEALTAGSYQKVRGAKEEGWGDNYIYICMHACMYVCMYVYVHIYVYTCVHVPRWNMSALYIIYTTTLISPVTVYVILYLGCVLHRRGEFRVWWAHRSLR